jgi:hypothetical protein
LRKLAQELLKEGRHRGDLTLFGPLLARWAEIDGTGLIAFVQGSVPPGERQWMLEHAWYAWGAVHPPAAAAAGKELRPALAKKLIAGMAESNLRFAVETALKLPDAQFNIFAIGSRLSSLSPDQLAALRPRAVYDGPRLPLEKAWRENLVKTDPAAAVEAAKKAGLIGGDQVPGVIAAVAKNDPAKAASLLAEMPSSRSRALSSVLLARTWAAQDAPAALAWTRQSLTGPVKQSALLEIAAATGGPDPASALHLVSEAGWEMETNFQRIVDGNSSREADERLTPEKTAAGLLRQIAAIDPAAARKALEQSVPPEHREAVASSAGLSP